MLLFFLLRYHVPTYSERELKNFKKIQNKLHLPVRQIQDKIHMDDRKIH